MNYAGTNYLAVVLAAIAAWLVGAVYYGFLGKSWMAALGKTKEQLMPGGKPSKWPFIISFIAELVMATVVAGAIGHLGAGQVTIKNGVISALILWAGLILTTMTTGYAYAGRGTKLLIIDAGHWLIVMAIIGLIIGAMG